MSFQEELAEKVAEIERLAKEMYGLRLRAQGLMVGEDGTLVDDPDMPVPMHPVDVDQEELMYRGLLSYLEQIKTRFELYYYLNTDEMVDLAAKIGGLKGRRLQRRGPAAVRDDPAAGPGGAQLPAVLLIAKVPVAT